MEKTQNAAQRKKYHDTWQQAVAGFQAHPVTADLAEAELQYWQAWAEEAAGRFHRSSSAVEGRNGYLAQMYHNRRGLAPGRLQALTVMTTMDSPGQTGPRPRNGCLAPRSRICLNGWWSKWENSPWRARGNGGLALTP